MLRYFSTVHFGFPTPSVGVRVNVVGVGGPFPFPQAAAADQQRLLRQGLRLLASNTTASSPNVEVVKGKRLLAGVLGASESFVQVGGALVLGTTVPSSEAHCGFLKFLDQQSLEFWFGLRFRPKFYAPN